MQKLRHTKRNRRWAPTALKHMQKDAGGREKANRAASKHRAVAKEVLHRARVRWERGEATAYIRYIKGARSSVNIAQLI